MTRKIYVIYKATCLVNEKVYIGFDSRWPKRQIEHKSVSFNPKSTAYHSYFHNAIRKHGWDNFVWEVIYASPDRNHTLTVMEPFFISAYRSETQLYNLTNGGEGVSGVKLYGEKNPNFNHNIFTFKHQNGTMFTGTRYAFSTTHNIPRHRIDGLINEKVITLQSGWSLAKPRAHKYETRETYTFFHPDHGIFTGRKHQFINKYPEIKNHTRSLCEMIQSKTGGVKGWSIIDESGNICCSPKENLFVFQHRLGSTYIGTRSGLKHHFPEERLNKNHLLSVTKGETASHKGWFCLEQISTVTRYKEVKQIHSHQSCETGQNSHQ